LGPYPISVVIATRVGWPKMRTSSDPVMPQVKQIGAQLIIVDSSGQPQPEWAADEDVLWIQRPGATPYELRQTGYAAADAPIIAVTEDHCICAPDWVAMHIEEHKRHPEAAAIFGMVDNASREHLIDWALYGVGYLASAPPDPSGQRNPSHANLSFKAETLRVVTATGDAVIEFRYLDRLRSAGYIVLPSARLLVSHVQSTGLETTSKLFFNNGRYIAGVRRQKMSGRDWLRALAPMPLAGYRTLRTFRIGRSKPAFRPVLVKSAPFVALLHGLHASGESVGYLLGPGNSANFLH
jgi:hypothetical protein